MPTPTPYEDSPTATLPMPSPTRPVAGRTVEDDTSVFDWTPVPDADRYRVQISDGRSFESLHYNETTDRPATISLESVLSAGTAVAYWRVRAETKDAAQSPWSDPAHFVLDSDEREEDILRVEAPPVPRHPTQDTPVDRNAVPFSWEEVPEASGYHLQVAPSTNFADPSIDLTLDQTTSVTLCDMLSPENSPLYWRIRALFYDAQPGPWSTAVPFNVGPSVEEDETLAPEATDPEASARASGPVQQGRTSRAMSVAVSLIAVVTFIATVLIVILMG